MKAIARATELAPDGALFFSDIFPTLVLLRYAFSDTLCNGRRLYSVIKQLLKMAFLASNQVVGSSNLSGRAIYITSPRGEGF